MQPPNLSQNYRAIGSAGRADTMPASFEVAINSRIASTTIKVGVVV